MANRRSIRVLSVMLLAAMVLSGCSAKSREIEQRQAREKEVAESWLSKDAAGTSNAATAEPTATPSPTPTDTPTPTPAPKIENIDNNEEGHYTFQKHVFGSAYLAEFGEKYRTAMYAFCDAVYSGQDTFDCPDQETYDWCTGRLSTYFCPIASEYVTRFPTDGGPNYKNGKGYIYYTVPKDEYMKKEKEFEDAITGIINDCVSDDYTDLEKVLALYEYMCRNYTYDYEMFDHSLEWMDKQSGYRCLTQKTGICCEIAALYNFLLLQVGVDSEEMGGSGNGDGHSWVFVTIGGESYHIDPTWGLTTDKISLDFFMMNDKIRAERDGFPTEYLTIAAWGDQSRKNYEYASTDEKYQPLWSHYYVGMDREAKEIVYEDYDGNTGRFYYGAE